MAHADLTHAFAGLAQWAKSSGIVEAKKALMAAAAAAEFAEDNEALVEFLSVLAEQPEPEEPEEEEKAPAKKAAAKKAERARQEDGTFQGDDPATTDTNEAFAAHGVGAPASVEP